MTRRDVLDFVIAELAKVRRYDTAIDLGTGTGAGMLALMPIVRQGIVGVDWSAPMLAEACRKCDEFGATMPDAPYVEAVREDIFELRYRNAFDLATCFGALGHIEPHQQEEFFGIVHRALKPGGVFALDALKLRWYSPTLWIMGIFDAVMRVRNRLWQPPFIMYYLHWLLPRVRPLFRPDQWSSVRVVPMRLKGKSHPFCVVIATKK